jgi:hypothetical protein
MHYIKELILFIKNVANDKRIPESDKNVLLILLALVISPIDLIPDWIPILGQLDDLMLLGIILDYFFHHLDQSILLSHYPWGMKSFVRIKKIASVVTFLAPKWFKKRIWSYKPEIYG